MLRRAAFLDRDGVLVQEIVRADGKAYAPTQLQDFRLVADAGVQVERLRQAGLACIVITNQPEIARSMLDPNILARMHTILRAQIGVDDVFVCGHVAEDECQCRKPRTGMLEMAAERWSLNLADSFVVGDTWRDMDAARAAGCFGVLIERSYSNSPQADARVSTLSEAVEVILQRLG